MPVRGYRFVGTGNANPHCQLAHQATAAAVQALITELGAGKNQDGGSPGSYTK
jgi:hypothetical protein